MTFAEVHIIVRGYVQGVGFRATIRNYAKQKNLKGTVRNMFDGTVEIYAQGNQKEIDNLINYLKAGANFGPGYVESVSVEVIDPPRSYSEFTIER